jgi:hypothetical protein
MECFDGLAVRLVVLPYAKAPAQQEFFKICRILPVVGKAQIISLGSQFRPSESALPETKSWLVVHRGAGEIYEIH